MRRVGTEAEIERRRKRNGMIIGIAMLMLLVASSVGFAFLSSDYTSGSQQPSGASSSGAISNTGAGGWVVPVLGREVRVTFGPGVVAEVPVSITRGVEHYQGRILYLAVDNPGIEAELRSTLGVFADRVQLACYGSCEKDLPEKDCSENILVWRDTPGGQVTEEEGCVFIEGDLRATDAFLYKVFGY